MSLNTAHANGGVVIYSGECILLYCDNVELQFEGADSREFHGTKKGRLYLTTHRMIFVNKDAKDRLQSFSFPFFTIVKVDLEQPIFGANYIKGQVKAQPGGNWEGQAIFKLKFMHGGAIEYGQAMLQAVKMASRYMPPQPPPYTPMDGPFYPAPPPAYTPPPGYYGFNPPTHMFPDAPPPDSVYTTNLPPPYPGIYAPPNVGQYGAPPGAAPPYGAMPSYGPPPASAPPYGGSAPPPGSAYGGMAPPAGPMYNGNVASAAPPHMMSSADAKAQEAAQSAYYNPSNPHYAYMPPPTYEHEAPPSYNEATKKND